MFPEKERTSKPPAEMVWRISIPAEGMEQSVEIPRTDGSILRLLAVPLLSAAVVQSNLES